MRIALICPTQPLDSVCGKSIERLALRGNTVKIRHQNPVLGYFVILYKLRKVPYLLGLSADRSRMVGNRCQIRNRQREITQSKRREKMNYKCRSLSTDEFRRIITAIKTGFVYESTRVHPNERIAIVLTVEANLGIRISDVLALRLSDIVKDGDRYRLSILEIKTKKPRNFTVPIEIYNYLQTYAYESGITKESKLFDIGKRVVQQHLEKTCKYLNIHGVSTHSFRKFFATQVYIESGYNVELVRELLQHSSVTTTQRYIGVGTKEIEEALQKRVLLI